MAKSKIFKKGDVLCFKNYSVTNNVGGTTMIKGRSAMVKITESWYDYETGVRAIGVLLDAEEIEFARDKATTIYTSKWYEEHIEVKASKEFIDGIIEAEKKFNPTIAYVSEFDLQ